MRGPRGVKREFRLPLAETTFREKRDAWGG